VLSVSLHLIIFNFPLPARHAGTHREIEREGGREREREGEVVVIRELFLLLTTLHHKKNLGDLPERLVSLNSFQVVFNIHIHIQGRF
jgi:hypothetical protein